MKNMNKKQNRRNYSIYYYVYEDTNMINTT